MGELISEGHGQFVQQKPEQNSGISRISQLKRDVQIYGTISALIPLVLLTALSDKQRKSVRDERDDGKCQFPADHACTPEKLEVHHVNPQRWEEDISIPEEVRDRPENLITICYNAHQVVVHPDMQDARRQYARGNKNAFRDVFVSRNEKVARREPYWNTIFDAVMLRVAKERTTNAKQRGWQMPERRINKRG